MSSQRRRSVVALVTLVGLAGPLACTDDSDHTEMAAISGTPSDTSPEAGFARDMSTHHAQAVAMMSSIFGYFGFQPSSFVMRLVSTA